MQYYRWTAVAFACVIALASPAFAQAERSLEACHKEAAKSLAKYLAAKQKALGNCLNKVSKEVIKSNKPAAGAARACGAQLNKLENSLKPEKTLLGKARAKILKKCDPATNPALPHNAAQVLALVPPGVTEGIEAKRLDNWCTYFNHDPNDVPGYADGSLDSVSEWLDCAFAITQCNATQAVALQYPRAIEWFQALAVALPALGPKYDSALVALARIESSIDVLDSGTPTINCGPGTETCGDGIANGTDQCDGVDLGGASCSTLGFKGGTLSCEPNCFFDFSDCVAGAFPATGQTTSYRAGDDGALQIGAPFAFTDNGNGTISDANSGLMWEKKGNDSGMHDKDTSFTWANAFAVHLDRMNNTCDGFEGNPNSLTPCTTNADCIGIGNQLCGHAGFRDWRIPNKVELQTLLDMSVRTPATTAIFDTACPNNCTVLTCSCTTNDKFWSSTTYLDSSLQAWWVSFSDGDVNYDLKTSTQKVRAVRGGGV